MVKTYLVKRHFDFDFYIANILSMAGILIAWAWSINIFLKAISPLEMLGYFVMVILVGIGFGYGIVLFATWYFSYLFVEVR